MIRLLALAGLATALTVTAFTVTPAAAQRKPFAQCMTDDGYGRLRPCMNLYRQGPGAATGQYNPSPYQPNIPKQPPY